MSFKAARVFYHILLESSKAIAMGKKPSELGFLKCIESAKAILTGEKP